MEDIMMDATIKLGKNIIFHKLVQIGKNSVIGNNVELGINDKQLIIGENSTIRSNSVIYGAVTIGKKLIQNLGFFPKYISIKLN